MKAAPLLFGDAFMLDVPAHTTTTFLSEKENKFFGDVHELKIRLPLLIHMLYTG